LEWFNVHEPSAVDKRRLAKLYFDGLFHAWDCPTCYDHFQGVLNQDFSFFGAREIFTEECIERQCDQCRCYPPIHSIGSRETGVDSDDLYHFA
jgi:hypothetical protein